MKKIVFTGITLFISVNLFAINKPKSIKTIDPIVISINLPKDQVWQRVMDLFVANSIPIKLVDKSSGLIQSDKIGLGSHYALKNADDSLVWALCEVVKHPESDTLYLFPQVINTELQVYIRETADGNVLLSLNLMNLTAAFQDPNIGITRDFAIESTKRLENSIGNYLKTNERIPTLTFDPPFAKFGEPPSQIKKRAVLAQKQAIQKQLQAKEDIKAKGAATIIGVIVLGILIAVAANKEEE